MMTLRMALFSAVTLTLLAGSTLPVAAQDDTRTEDVLFELRLPVETLPDTLDGVDFKWTALAAGSDWVGGGNEGWLGTAFLVLDGEYLVEPLTDALIWEADSATVSSASAGVPTVVNAGEAIWLPAAAGDALDPDALFRLANSGTEEATAVRFHAHEAGGYHGEWPTSLRVWSSDLRTGPEPTKALAGQDLTLRLVRLTLEPGAEFVPMEPPAITAIQVADGLLEERAVGPSGEFAFDRRAGTSAILQTQPREGLELTWAADADEPTQLMVVTVIPAALLTR